MSPGRAGRWLWLLCILCLSTAIRGEETSKPGNVEKINPVYKRRQRGVVTPATHTRAPLRVYSHPDQPISLAFSSDGKVLAAGDASGKVWLWPLGSEELVRTIKAHKRGVRALAFSPDGSSLVTGGGDGMVRVWDLHDLKAQAWLDAKHRGPVTTLTYNSKGTLILSGSKDDSIWMRDAITGQKLAVYFGHSADVSAVTVAQDGRCVISGSEDGSLQGWSTVTGEQVDFSTQNSKVLAAVLSPKGSMLASATADGMVALRRTDGCTVHTIALRLELHTGPVHGLIFSPSGQWLYSGGDDGRLIRWNIDRGIPVEEFEGPQEPILALAISPDGALLASATRDRMVRIWKQGETSAFGDSARHSQLLSNGPGKWSKKPGRPSYKSTAIGSSSPTSAPAPPTPASVQLPAPGPMGPAEP